MGVFHVFWIAQIVQNHPTRLICIFWVVGAIDLQLVEFQQYQKFQQSQGSQRLAVSKISSAPQITILGIIIKNHHIKIIVKVYNVKQGWQMVKKISINMVEFSMVWSPMVEFYVIKIKRHESPHQNLHF